jgi:6-phosphogluconolactonase (cycloisomerase 2 family)
VVHPGLKKIFFADFHKNGVNIMTSSLNGSNESVEVLIRDVGEVTSMAIDTKTNKLYWAAFNGQGGTLSVANVDGKNGKVQKTIRAARGAIGPQGLDHNA